MEDLEVDGDKCPFERERERTEEKTSLKPNTRSINVQRILGLDIEQPEGRAQGSAFRNTYVGPRGGVCIYKHRSSSHRRLDS